RASVGGDPSARGRRGVFRPGDRPLSDGTGEGREPVAATVVLAVSRALPSGRVVDRLASGLIALPGSGLVDRPQARNGGEAHPEGGGGDDGCADQHRRPTVVGFGEHAAETGADRDRAP